MAESSLGIDNAFMGPYLGIYRTALSFRLHVWKRSKVLNKCFSYNLSHDFSEGKPVKLVKGNGNTESRWFAQGRYGNCYQISQAATDLSSRLGLSPSIFCFSWFSNYVRSHCGALLLMSTKHVDHFILASTVSSSQWLLHVSWDAQGNLSQIFEQFVDSRQWMVPEGFLPSDFSVLNFRMLHVQSKCCTKAGIFRVI